jgi:predicted chitinase
MPDVLTPATLIHCGIRSDLAHLHVPLMRPAMREHGITTHMRARMFIAQVLEESIALTAFHELASGIEYDITTHPIKARELGNLKPGDGPRYKGRGPIQLTGRSNYRKFGKLLGLDLEGHPDLAAQPRIAWRVSTLYFENAGCNRAADNNDFLACTRAINGGLNGLNVRQHYFALLQGQGVLPGKAFLSVGDHGHAIVTMTRRLSYLHYLDGKRETFDAESERALRRFQTDHHLHIDGHFGPESLKALAHATARAKAARAHPAPVPRPQPHPHPVPVGHPHPVPVRNPHPVVVGHPATGVELIGEMSALDARSDRLLHALERRRRVLEALVAHRGPSVEGEIDDLAARLARLEVAVAQIRSELTTVESAGTVLPPGTAGLAQAQPSAQPEPAAAVVTEPQPGVGGAAIVTPAAAVVIAPGDNGHDLMDASTRDLELRLARLSRAGDRLRALLLDRFTALEHAAGTLDRPRPVPHPGRPQPARPVPKPGPARPVHDTEDGHDGSAAGQRPGGRSWPIRQSKLAVQRYLKAKDPSGSLALRRKLQRERLSPVKARAATDTWTTAIKAAQKLAGLPQSGHLDGQLVRVLRTYWPAESPPRRVVKGTPGAWRLIPGQLTRNFNIREFACHDGTGYVAGLVREQGLTKQQAKGRAKELAKRLERVRRIEGDRPLRPTSVYRTKAYNAHVGGSAKNSAHTRGFAADVPPPPAITLNKHRQNMRAAFEGGIGFYVQMHFVHGDFDMEPGFGFRAWNGP